jgi:hypothetical protein
VDPISKTGIRNFLTAARKRVSRYGITRKCYVLRDIPTEVSSDTFDVYYLMLEGLVWLDEPHDWFWFRTNRNRVLNRLAKILRIAPRLAISEARTAILRDRRMEDVELPPDVFRNLCASLPWCQVEGDDVAAGRGMPEEEEDDDDSNERLLV